MGIDLVRKKQLRARPHAKLIDGELVTRFLGETWCSPGRL